MPRRSIVLLLAALLATVAFGQKKEKAPTQRTVTGVVTDGNDSPIPGAIVQLKDLKTLQVRSFITKDKGDYYFNGLSLDVDYEFKAEYNGKSSDTRRLSTFDTHPSVIINLKIKP